jgi:serine/threonine protein kinase
VAAETDPLVGQLLEERFLVMSRLGRGGMGLVYVAEDVQLRRRCALKVLRPEFTEDPDNVERFLREAQAIARLSHEHIVNIFSLGRDPSGAVFFAMELLAGEDLEARLRDAARPTRWREVCEWSVQIARAVAAVHEAGLVHRDLKPGNIFLSRRRDGSEFVKLLDFGIVRPEDSEMTSTGATLGTPHYMSPEQVRARPLDRRSDIYSFGVLLFRALTGRLPFRGEPFQVAIMHVEATAPRPGDVAPERDIPDVLGDIVLRALLKDPAERFQSMEDMEAALRAVLQSIPADVPLVPAPAASSTSLSLTSQPATPAPTLAPQPVLPAPPPVLPAPSLAPPAPPPRSLDSPSPSRSSPRSPPRSHARRPSRPPAEHHAPPHHPPRAPRPPRRPPRPRPRA